MQCLIRILLLLGLLSCLEAQSLTCQPSTNDYDCMASPNENYSLHWTLRGNELCLRLEASTSGWVGIGFAQVLGSMAPADAVVGWVDEDGVEAAAYNITRRNLFEDDENPEVTLSNVFGDETDDGTVIQFCVDLTQLIFELDPQEVTPVNWAYGRADSLAFHGRNRGSETIRFADSLADDEPPPPSSEGPGDDEPPPPSSEGPGDDVPPPPSSEGPGDDVPPPPSSEGPGDDVPPPPSSEGPGDDVPPPPSSSEGPGDDVPPPSEDPDSKHLVDSKYLVYTKHHVDADNLLDD